MNTCNPQILRLRAMIPAAAALVFFCACRPDDKAPRSLPPLPSDAAKQQTMPPHGNIPNPHAEVSADAAAAGEFVKTVSAQGVEFAVPQGWKYVKPKSTMRVAELIAPRSAGDNADGSVVVFYFAGGAGGFEQNVARWAGQLAGPDGAPLTRDKATTREMAVGSLTARIFEADGNYTETSMTGEVKARIAGAKMVVAMIEANDGGYFFKFTGPAKTVTDLKPAFEELLKSAKFAK
jgi:hypothetical protein